MNMNINKNIEWNEIHRKIEESSAAIEKCMNRSPEHKHAVLKARAIALAKEPEKVDNENQFLEIISFRLASETYGIETKYIREVYPLKDFTPIPGTPSFVLGMANIRGRILSVIDLKKFFNLPEKGLGELNKIIIVRNEIMEFGILANSIIGTASLNINDLQTSLPALSEKRNVYIKALTNDRTALLDMEKILNDQDIVVNQDN